MRVFLFSVIVLLASAKAFGQDTTAHQKKGIIGTVRQKYNEARSGVRSQPDSLKTALTTRSDSTHSHKSDTTKQKLIALKDSADSVKQTPSQGIAKVNSKISNANSKIDSIEQKLNTPVNTLNNKISEAEQKVNEKVGLGENGVNGKIDKIEGKIDNGFSKATDGTVQRPGEDINVGAESLTGGTSANGIDGVNPLGDKNAIPGVEQTKLPEGDISLEGLKEKAGVEIPEQEKIKDISENVNGIDGKLAEGEAYENEIRSMKEGDFSSTEKVSSLAEEKAQNIEQVQASSAEIQKAVAEQEKYAALIKRYQDKKALQKEIERKAMNVANQQLNQYSPAFKEAQAELAKAKKLNPSVKSFKEMKQKRVNEMKGKPFYEHLIPGITVQGYYLDKIFTTDLGAQIGYKFSKRFVVGSGVLYRLSFSEKYDTWIHADNVYGFRNYVNFELYKSFYAHAEFSGLYGSIDTKNPEVENQKVYTGYFGIGKRYDISRKLKGSILMLYRAQFKGEVPMMSKVNMRIEFNYNTKKRKKRSWELKGKSLKKQKAST